MQKFKKGDEVIAVDVEGTSLKNGETYTILDYLKAMDGKFYYKVSKLEPLSSLIYFNESRFELANEKIKIKNINKSEIYNLITNK